MGFVGHEVANEDGSKIAESEILNSLPLFRDLSIINLMQVWIIHV